MLQKNQLTAEYVVPGDGILNSPCFGGRGGARKIFLRHFYEKAPG
jgi:hypothetical protein